MSRGGGKSSKTGRTVTPDEAELWNRLAHSLDKVKAKPRVASNAGSVAATPAAPARTTPAPAKSQPPVSPRPVPPAPPAKSSRPPPLADFDRRAVRQVASGKVTIDARLDLHGMRQRDAHAELRAFLIRSQSKGFKTVLVITGKGGDTAADRDHLARALGEPQRGVLRRSVPQWLEEPELRAIVLSYTTASVRHGGDGALYVQLRKGGRDV